ncbi:MAG: metallophosphoesterase [Oscillospiraceae bacterium]|nr:metallophosphoesterase [Oscillospiraceae bacterium]
MPKFFVFSDVHGFYSMFMEALDNAGYDKNNPEHWLISCGDNFDRGNVEEYLKNLP